MLNSISFGKKLVANCQVKRPISPVSECKIFELEKTDNDYFDKVKSDHNWDRNRFLWIMQEQTKPERFDNDTQIFVLENNTGECLGYINLISRANKLIQYLEITPQIIKLGNKAFSKEIARTLISAVVNSAQKENKEKISVLAFDFHTKKFYTKNCGFKSGIQTYDYVLDKKHYSKFLEKYTKNDGVSIDFNV